jgi:hypothetical protein
MHGAVCVCSRNALVQLAAILFIAARRDPRLGRTHSPPLIRLFHHARLAIVTFVVNIPFAFSAPLSSSRVLLAGSMPGAYFYCQAIIPCCSQAIKFKFWAINPFLPVRCATFKRTTGGAVFEAWKSFRPVFPLPCRKIKIAF